MSLKLSFCIFLSIFLYLSLSLSLSLTLSLSVSLSFSLSIYLLISAALISFLFSFSFQIDPIRDLVYVKGAVPGNPGEHDISLTHSQLTHSQLTHSLTHSLSFTSSFFSLPPSFYLSSLFFSSGTFLRIVDAVKGPFHQTPAPFPTYLLQKDDPEFPKYSLFAPVSESDSQKLKEPEDAY